MDETVLSIKNITKRFGAFTANDDISLEVHKGEVLTLLGENGAGKSTLMNILCGLYHPTSGAILIRGKKVTFSNASDAVKYGIGMVHQHFMLVDVMTVFQNIILGRSGETSLFIREKRLRREILALSQRYGLNVELDKPISDISVGAQQRVEILKALWRGAQILILDEPTAVLTDEETDGLFDIIRNLTGEGKSVIFISHKLREVMQISDRILILRHGKLVAEFDPKETDRQTLANAMVGRQLAENVYEKKRMQGEPILSLQNVSFNKRSKHNGLNNISFDIYHGEIFGVAGVDGNGQSELAQVVAGLAAPDSGLIMLKGKPLAIRDPMRVIREGVAHIPEDRNRMGLVGDMTIEENFIMKAGQENTFTDEHGWKLKRKNIPPLAQMLCKRYDIRCSGTQQLARDLSGGNQQKVILAREMEQNPQLLIAVHPTRGLDVGAATYIHDRMIQAREQGCAILLISTDLAEVLLMADRIGVMFEGRIQGIFSGAQPPMDDISAAMAGKTFID